MSSAGRKKTPTRSSTKTPSEAELDRPFSGAILKKAREIVSQYRLLIQPAEQLGFTGRTVEMPGVLGDGKTHEECVRSTLMAAETAVAVLLEREEKPPNPAAPRRRNEQLNIRLTAEEKLMLEEESQRRGFRGVSDFVRSVALKQL